MTKSCFAKRIMAVLLTAGMLAGFMDTPAFGVEQVQTEGTEYAYDVSVKVDGDSTESLTESEDWNVTVQEEHSAETELNAKEMDESAAFEAEEIQADDIPDEVAEDQAEELIEEITENFPDEITEDDDPLLERYLASLDISPEDMVDFSDFFLTAEAEVDAEIEAFQESIAAKNYNHGKYATGKSISKGIDVSKFQGSINWSKVKADGVEFAFIRVGYRGYGSAGTLNEDVQYQNNISGALSVGIPVGVYMFSQAITTDEAVAEAEYILQRIKKYNITLPVIMDYEFAGSPGRLRAANLSKAQATAICNAFCEKVENAGYDAMVYADYNMLTNYLNPGQIANKYKIWIARWNTSTGYSGDYSAWQFTNAGNVDGIAGVVDLDFAYDLLDIPVVLDANGGAFDQGEQVTLKLKGSQTVGAALENNGIDNPLYPGRDFVGWSTDREATTPDYNLDQPMVKKLTLYAVWSSEYNRQASAVEAYEYGRSGKGEAYSADSTNNVNPGSRVALSTELPNAEIYYCIGENAESVATPSAETGIRYTSPIVITDATVIKAVAVKNGYNSSAVTQYYFAVNDLSEDMGQVLEEDLPGDDSMTRAERVSMIPDGFWTSKTEAVTYDGKTHKPTPRVYYGKLLLEEKKDYTLSYTGNTNAGTATINVTGKGGYNGACSSDFDIQPRNISEAVGALSSTAVVYNAKKAQSPAITLNIDGRKLSLNKDYYIESITRKADSANPEDMVCASAKEPGTYIFKVSAKSGSNYVGGGDVKFDIKNSECILLSTLSIDKIPDQTYAEWSREDGTAEVTPLPVLRNKSKQAIDISGSDFDVKYTGNISVGTATVTITATAENATYAGSKSATFKITGYPMSKVSVTGINPSNHNEEDVSKYLKYGYNGSAWKPLGDEGVDSSELPEDCDIKLSYTKAKGAEPVILSKGIDYTVSYLNNVKAGTATMVLTGRGRFTGTLKKTFKITEYVPAGDEVLEGHVLVQFKTPDSVSADNVAHYEYIKDGVTPLVNVYYEPLGGVTKGTTEPSANAILLTAKTDYTISYSNYKAVAEHDSVSSRGKSIAPTITITGKNSFKGKVIATYTIDQRDIKGMTLSVNDRVASSKANQFAVAPAITDPNTGKNTKLAAGTDYNKTLTYTYVEQTRISRYNSKTKATTCAVVSAGSKVGNMDIVPAGTAIRVNAEGINNYKGTISGVYHLSGLDISSAAVKVADQMFKGYPVTPDKDDITSISIKNGGVKTDIKDYEYEIVPGSYTKNTAAGTGSFRIHGLGQYCGYKTVSFKITARNMYYLIAFNANGGVGTMKTQSISKAGTQLLNNGYKRDGYDFAGWNTEKDGKGTSFENKEAIYYVQSGKSQTLYAQWTPVEYSIKYVLNGGNNAAGNPDKYTIEDRITFADATPSSEMGKVRFGGWYSDVKLTKPITRIEKGSKGNISIYAAWEKDYEVVSLNVASPSQAEIKNFVNAHPVSTSDSWKVKPSQSGNISAGVLSDATINSSLNALNNIRYMAGLDADVVNDETYSYMASAATLLNSMNNQLSHFPGRPGVMKDTKYDDLYDAGYDGTGSANIAWASWDSNLKYAIVNQWMYDSNSSNISTLGHRRWILYPNMKKTGFGKTLNGDGGSYFAMYAFDGFEGYTGKMVAWPAQNTMASYFASGSAWSLSMGQGVSSVSDHITIIVQNRNTGEKKTMKAKYVENSYYGDPGCIIFTPGVSSSAGSSYSVMIQLDDYEKEIRYDVNFF